ncbi:hypothetical protein Pmani_007575 [Petrolisthes manimaculis]|uniref:Vacuolar protein sorting-associated protein 13A n=1 Tax=Petrolisthes manimaculis TaxID=1843537 RepID=A0AAE1Q8L1_9EUCA|nr:hypothetical protein Pmani_007575 [Petrolisthes manimaculis]
MEWLAKKVVAGLVNRYLGQYLEDLDTQEVNDALLSGQVNLTNLRIRRDALSFLDVYFGGHLPVEVCRGSIGRISLTIPYTSLFSQPVVITIEDVLVLVTPVVEYDDEREKDLERAGKKQTLAHLFPDLTPQDSQDSAGLWGMIYKRVWNNLELHITNVHIRYEDVHSCPQPLAMGLCLHALSAHTTNHKWKKGVSGSESGSGTVNKVLDATSASLYINPGAERQRMVTPHAAIASSNTWLNYLEMGLHTFSINDEPFQFVMEPVRCKVKMRQHVVREARVPGLLVDAVVRDAALALSHQQYLALTQLAYSLTTYNTHRKFHQFRPSVPLKRHADEWWQYAAKSIIQYQIQPYSWQAIKKHRQMYKKYEKLYHHYLLEGHSGELEADLMRLEDSLSLTNIVLARVSAKIKLSREEPSLVRPVVASDGGWLSWLWGSSGGAPTGQHQDKNAASSVAMDVVGVGASRNVPLATLTLDEKRQLQEELTRLDAPHGHTHPDDIDHKAYLSLQNVTMVLREGGRDIALATLSGLVTSAESRGGVAYNKLSFKAESFNLECINLEQELVYVARLVEATPSAGYGVAFSLDLERNPLSVSADYALTMKLHPIEFLYNQYACAEMMQFFQVPGMSKVWVGNETRVVVTEGVMKGGRAALIHALARRSTLHLDVDIKSPFLVLPEHGSIQRGGSVLVVDAGGLRVTTEVGGGQTRDLEDATRMELEERLYDRLTLAVSQLQVLFADSGDEWRVHRTREDSDSHILPRVRVRIDVANSIHPEYRQQPRQKLDIHVTPIKFNLSDNRLSQLVEFVHNLPAPHSSILLPDTADSDVVILPHPDPMHTVLDPTLSQLRSIRDTLLIQLQGPRLVPDTRDHHQTPPLLRHVRPMSQTDTISQTSLELEKYFSTSDNSDDEGESWSRPVDLPGFEDNTSPQNMITVLSRFCVDELVVGISRSCDRGERPYLMARATHLIMEAAMMDYGPAVQVTLGSIHLVDKYHHNPSGQYLELVSSPQATTKIVTILYRKVRANCPDFKTHFHSCEQSLVIDLATLNVVCHRGSIITLTNFFSLLSTKLGHIQNQIPRVTVPEIFIAWLKSGPEDPPVPSGASKWSFASHLRTLNFKLCDNDIDFLQAKVGGFQGECVFKANEKKIFRASLSELSVEDVSDITLYSKIIDIEEDRVFDIKYVEFSPTHRGVEEIDTSVHGINPDAALRVRVGRIQCVFLCKFLADLQRFMEPLLNREGTHVALKQVEKVAEAGCGGALLGKKLSLSIDIHAPTVLVPQKSDSSSLLVVSLGDLKVDNMFKIASGSTGGAVENILVEIGPAHICRGVMILGCGLEMQEDILEPATIRADVKRSLVPQCRDLLSWDLSMHMGSLCINLGQCDLSTILAVITQNRAEAQFFDSNGHSQPLTPVDLTTPLNNSDDNMGKLQAFLTNSVDIYRIADALVSMDGLTLTLYSDMDEVLSSPVRDAATALCRIEVGEIEVHGDMNSDHSMDLRLTLHSLDVFDVRPDNDYHIIKKIFGQYSKAMNLASRRFSISVPPMMDVMYKVSPSGDGAVEVSVERTRLNISVSFVLSVYKYVFDAIPGMASTSGGILNPGFVGDLGPTTTVDGVKIVRRPPSSVDSTSGYLSTVTSNTDDQRTLSISINVKRPEVVLFADPEDKASRVLVARCEVHAEYSRHPGNESFHFTLDGCQVFATTYSHSSQNPYSVIQPCDIEGAWVLRTVEEGVRAELKLSQFYLHLNPSVVHLFRDLVEELTTTLSPHLTPFKLQFPSTDLEDLWSPKPLTATISTTNPDEEVYIKQEYPTSKPQQRLVIKISVITVSFEKQALKTAVPVLLLKSALNAEINDWSQVMFSKAEVQLQLSCYNEEFSAWEPVLEPITEENKMVRSWEALVRTLQHPAQPIGNKRKNHPPNLHIDSVDISHAASHRGSHLASHPDISESSTDEEHRDNEMVVLRPHPSPRLRYPGPHAPTPHLEVGPGYPLDSDSETEDSVIHKISSAFTHMFSGESEQESSLEEAEEDEEEVENEEGGVNGEKKENENDEGKLKEEQVNSGEEEDVAVFASPSRMTVDGVDGGVGEDGGSSMGMVEGGEAGGEGGDLATCVFVDSRDPLEVTLTPNIIASITSLLGDYLTRPPHHCPLPVALPPLHSQSSSHPREIKLINEIGPNSRVSVVGSGKTVVVTSAKYQEPDSVPSSPASGISRSRGGSLFSDGEEDSLAEGCGRRCGGRYTSSSPTSPPSHIHSSSWCLAGDWDQLSLHSCPGMSWEAPHPSVPATEPAFDQFCPNPVTLYQDTTKLRLHITVPGFDELTVFVGTRSRSRIFQLSPALNGRRYHLVVSVEINFNSTTIIARSPLQILNELPLPINICYKKSMVEGAGWTLGEAVSPVNPFEPHAPVVTLQPDQVFTIPLSVAYHSPLHIQPAAAEFEMSEEGAWWKDVLTSTCPYYLTSVPKTDINPHITAAVSAEPNVELNMRECEGLGGVVPSYTLHLLPPLTVYNHLPCTLSLKHPALAHPLVLDPGHHTRLYHTHPSYLLSLGVQVLNYLGSDWEGSVEVWGDSSDEHRTLTLTHGDGSRKRRVEVALYSSRGCTTSLYLYSPYWIVNKTGLPIHVRGSRSKIVYEVSASEEVVLFRYKRGHPHKLKLRVVESEWSCRWGCEAVGSCGVVVCTDSVRGKKYRVLARVKQSVLAAQPPQDGGKYGSVEGQLHLTKIVTLLPYFLVRNLTPRPLRFMQESEKVELWYDLTPQQCMAFWPDGEEMHMVVRYRDQQVRSQHFHFNSNHTTVLRMEKGRAVMVTVTGVGSDRPVTITLDRYYSGDAPVRVENWCDDVHLRLHQKGSNQTHLLAPHQMQLYTWDDPTLPRELLWNTYSRNNNHIPAVIDKDDHGNVCVTVTSLRPGLARTRSQSSVSSGTKPTITRPRRSPMAPTPKLRARARTQPASSSDTDEESSTRDDHSTITNTTTTTTTTTTAPHHTSHHKWRGARRDRLMVHWVSHKVGGQRVLLFTQSDRLAASTRLPNETASLEFCLSLERIGLSLMSGNHWEVIYGSMMSGAAQWEVEVDGEWKVPPSLELVAWLEDQYLHNSHSKVNLKGSLQVDLAKMYMTRPFSGRLRRVKQPGVWVHFRTSPHFTYATLELHRLQVDNQLADAVFPTVLYPTNQNGATHPCLSVCALIHTAPRAPTTIKHLSVVTQEFSLKVDKSLVVSICELLGPLLTSPSPTAIHAELKTLKTPVSFQTMQQVGEERGGVVVERVCVAGLRLRFSFSPRGSVLHAHTQDALQWFLMSLGATLTEVQKQGMAGRGRVG